MSFSNTYHRFQVILYLVWSDPNPIQSCKIYIWVSQTWSLNLQYWSDWHWPRRTKTDSGSRIKIRPIKTDQDWKRIRKIRLSMAHMRNIQRIPLKTLQFRIYQIFVPFYLLLVFFLVFLILCFLIQNSGGGQWWMRIPFQVVASFFRKKPDRASMSFDILIPAPEKCFIIYNKYLIELILVFNILWSAYKKVSSVPPHHLSDLEFPMRRPSSLLNPKFRCCAGK